MSASDRLPGSVVDSVRDGPRIGIKAGTKPHRVIGIWAVVVQGRVFVRSWSLKPRSWNRTFREDPVGELHVDGRVIRVRAKRTRGERLLATIDKAYLEKYHTPGSIGFARDMAKGESRTNTMELVPVRARRAR